MIQSAGAGNFGTSFLSLLSRYVWDKLRVQWVKKAKSLEEKSHLILQYLFDIGVDTTCAVRTEQLLFSGIKVASKYILSLVCLLEFLLCDFTTLFPLCKKNVKTILVKSVFSTKPPIEYFWYVDKVHTYEELKQYGNPCQLMEVCILSGIPFPEQVGSQWKKAFRDEKAAR